MERGIQVIDEIETQVRLARCYRNTLGYSGDPDSPRLIDRLLENDALISLFVAPWEDHGRWPASTMQKMDFLGGLLGMHTETWLPRCEPTNSPNGLEIGHSPTGLTGDLIELQKRWEGYLDQHNLLDFTTLQKRFLERQRIQDFGLQHVFVDEFQDTNPIQFAIHVGWLDRMGVRLTTVGDDDQSMYRFRGSDIDCFQQLAPYCEAKAIPFRREKLEENWRSTRAIVHFSRDFKQKTVLNTISMPKELRSPRSGAGDPPPRLLEGGWEAICDCLADELHQRGIGLEGSGATETAAILMFSTSERGTQTRSAPARALREQLEARGLRVYNPRNKTAAERGSPVAELLGLISYLVDPITVEPAGKGGRMVEVFASEPDKAAYALARPPTFPISKAHITFQKWFRKGDETRKRIDSVTPDPDCQELIDYIDTIRENLVQACGKGQNIRLTMAGLVARLLTFDRYRESGFTFDLFRQALFTDLLEANIAPTRMSMGSLDSPLHVKQRGGKYYWDWDVWRFLGTFGSLLQNTDLDDAEVEAFAQHAVAVLTFHQCKGLEFDHIYVACTGRNPSPHSVLRTKLFSGEAAPFQVVSAQPVTADKGTLDLAMADREREVFVALTRAKKTLTILHDPNHGHPLMQINPAIEMLFHDKPALAHPAAPSVNVKEYT